MRRTVRMYRQVRGEMFGLWRERMEVIIGNATKYTMQEGEVGCIGRQLRHRLDEC